MRPLRRKPLLTLTEDSFKELYPTYAYFNKEMAFQFGLYCNFCEAPFFSYFEVHPKLPSEKTVDFNKAFLMCKNCHTHRNYYCQMHSCTEESFIWPDDENHFSSDYFLYKNSSKKLIDLKEQGIFQLLPDTPHTDETLNRFYKQVWVLPNEKYKDNLKLYERIKATICAFGLNYYLFDDIDPLFTDRRVYFRTQAWEKAAQLAERLYAIKSTDVPGERLSEGFVKLNEESVRLNIESDAVNKGFWSVWMTIFEDEKFSRMSNSDENAITTLLCNRFSGTRTR